MAAYSYYIQDYYADSMAELERFLKIYSNHKDLDYAYYLLALCYYEQIVDEKKDLNSILKSKEIFEILIKKYPLQIGKHKLCLVVCHQEMFCSLLEMRF